MRVTRRSFLGGAVGSIALLFGGFGWKEPEDWYVERETGLTMDEIMKQPIDPYSTRNALRDHIRANMDKWMADAIKRKDGRYFVTVHPDVAAQIRSWDEAIS